MAQYIRDKYRRFAGSAVDGATAPTQTHLTPSVDEETGEEVVSLATIADEVVLDDELDEATAYFLSQSEVTTHIYTYADNPSQAMRDHLFARIKNENQDVLGRLSRNEEIPVEVLELLAEDEEDWVRMGVAWNEKAPSEVLVRLSGDEDPYVRVFVVLNPNTPLEVLTCLVWDEDEQVRYEVAQSKRTPIEALEYLAEDNYMPVLFAVAENPNTPPEVLARLAKDEYEEVRSAAIKNLTGASACQLSLS